MALDVFSFTRGALVLRTGLFRFGAAAAKFATRQWAAESVTKTVAAGGELYAA